MTCSPLNYYQTEIVVSVTIKYPGCCYTRRMLQLTARIYTLRATILIWFLGLNPILYHFDVHVHVHVGGAYTVVVNTV